MAAQQVIAPSNSWFPSEQQKGGAGGDYHGRSSQTSHNTILPSQVFTYSHLTHCNP